MDKIMQILSKSIAYKPCFVEPSRSVLFVNVKPFHIFNSLPEKIEYYS